MAFTPGYKYDVFISYAHGDNATAERQEEGWVDKFHNYLALTLARRMGKSDTNTICRDKRRLDGSHQFDKVIEEDIEQSAIMMSLTSPSYLQSEYCRKELRHFYDKCQSEAAGLYVDDRSRILNVLLNNIHHGEWPEEFQGSTGFPFHEPEDGDKFCYPLDPSDESEKKAFQKSIEKLVEVVYRILTALAERAPSTSMTDQSARSQDPPDSSDPTTEAPKQTESVDVYLAAVADSLKLFRGRVLTELEDKGLKVCANIPPPYSAQAHEQALVPAMQKARLTVHLLDHLAGAEIEEQEDTTYPHRQVELAKANDRPQLIWVPRELDLQKIEDQTHANFLKELESSARDQASYEYIRSTKEEIVRVIAEKLSFAPHPAEPATTQPSVLLDTHVKDTLAAVPVFELLSAKNIQPFLNPEADDPRQNIKILRERLKQATAIIICFGQVSAKWVRSRLEEVIKIVIAEHLPIKAAYVYLAPPEEGKDPTSLEMPFVNILDSRKGFNPDVLAPLFATLGV